MTSNHLLPGKLKTIGTLAIAQVGEVVGIRWCTVGPDARRTASVYFRYLAAAYAFAKVARRAGYFAVQPTGDYQRLNDAGDRITHRYEPVAYRGFAVLVLLTPDAKQPNGWRQAPPFREQPGVATFGHLTERERAGATGYRQQREPDAPLEHWYDAEVERELDRVDADITHWWRGRGYKQNSPLDYLAAAEQRKTAARDTMRGPLWQERTRKAVAEGVAAHDVYTTKQQARREQQQHDLRVNADDAEILAELGRWNGDDDDCYAADDSDADDA